MTKKERVNYHLPTVKGLSKIKLIACHIRLKMILLLFLVMTLLVPVPAVNACTGFGCGQAMDNLAFLIRDYYLREGRVTNYLDLNPESNKYLYMFLPRITGFGESDYDAILKFENRFPYEFSVERLTDAYQVTDFPTSYNFSQKLTLHNSEGERTGIHVPELSLDTGGIRVAADVGLLLKHDFDQSYRLFVNCLYFDTSNTTDKFQCGVNQPFTITDYSIVYNSENQQLIVYPEFAIYDQSFKVKSLFYTIDGVKVSEVNFRGDGVSIFEFSQNGFFGVNLETLDAPLLPGTHELGVAAIYKDGVSYVADIFPFKVEEAANFEMDFSAVTGVEVGTSLVLETDGPSGSIDRSLFYDGLLAYGTITNRTTQSFDVLSRGNGELSFTFSADGRTITSINLHQEDENDSSELVYVGSGIIPYIGREYANRIEYRISGTDVCDFLQTATKSRGGSMGYDTVGMKCDSNTSFWIALRKDVQR